ncbi:excisionase family DNA binding protein [Planifilum fimeticola]|uniref:Excisionase family DNA binding protein n=1 Tax=Planifilum fimeticola TaxID=201975 RepID=A0A2T0LC53_9BACL|nr:helix-turn-helix domain-containing protein [Planifilum fimeticola]PRX39489.1 excisionase family DNA binding protein [Planifilum fimeticola]
MSAITPLPNQHEDPQSDAVLQLLKAVADLNEKVIRLAQGIDGNPQPLTYSVGQAAKVLGVSRSKMYDLLHRPDFPVITIDHRKLIPRRQLERWLDQQCERK